MNPTSNHDPRATNAADSAEVLIANRAANAKMITDIAKALIDGVVLAQKQALDHYEKITTLELDSKLELAKLKAATSALVIEKAERATLDVSMDLS